VQLDNPAQNRIGKMGNIMGKEKPLKEVMRENKRMINRAVRELDREKVGLEREEKRLTMEIKKAARENQISAVRTMAKDLVRTRQHISKFIEMRRCAATENFGHCLAAGAVR
jgi:charged multivesicular body protein 2A